MTLSLEENEIAFIMQVLGELPSKTGAFVLLQKLDEQVKAQTATQPEYTFPERKLHETREN